MVIKEKLKRNKGKKGVSFQLNHENGCLSSEGEKDFGNGNGYFSFNLKKATLLKLLIHNEIDFHHDHSTTIFVYE